MYQTSFFGSFKITSSYQSKILSHQSAVANISDLITNKPDYSFSNEEQSIFIWGRLYDLKNTCEQFNLSPETSNPAKLFLHILSNFGAKSIARFYGEFTYVYYDLKKIVIGRDTCGASVPVFYCNEYFSDSIASFKHLNDFSFEPDFDSLKTFLHLGSIPPPYTGIRSIKQLAHGEYLIWENDKITIDRLITFEDYASKFGSLKISSEEATEELERLHLNAVNRRIEGKHKIGLLLSGGYDSGGNAYATRKLFNGEIDGFTIGFKDDTLSEIPLARIIAGKFGINLHEYSIDGSEINELPKIVRFLSNPFQENGLMVNFTVMKEVSTTNPQIVLGGDGNDQVFGTGIRELALRHFSGKYSLAPLQKVLSQLSGFSLFSDNGLVNRIQFHNLRVLKATSFTSFGFTQLEIDKLVLNKHKLRETDFLKINHVKINSFNDLFIAHTYHKDFCNDACGIIIHKASAMSKLFGVNLTFPYMDSDSIKFVSSLPRELRFSGKISDVAKGHGKSKWTHKKYLEEKLPYEITHRKKQGGFAPLPVFFNDIERRKVVYTVIRKSGINKTFLKPESVEKFLSWYESFSQKQNIWFWYRQIQAFRLFNLLVLALWWDIHVEGKNGEELQDFL